MSTPDRDRRYIPVYDCPSCGLEDTPASMRKMGKGDQVVRIYSCPGCDVALAVIGDMEPDVKSELEEKMTNVEYKRLVSLNELEELGWERKFKVPKIFELAFEEEEDETNS